MKYSAEMANMQYILQCLQFRAIKIKSFLFTQGYHENIDIYFSPSLLLYILLYRTYFLVLSKSLPFLDRIEECILHGSYRSTGVATQTLLGVITKGERD